MLANRWIARLLFGAVGEEKGGEKKDARCATGGAAVAISHVFTRAGRPVRSLLSEGAPLMPYIPSSFDPARIARWKSAQKDDAPALSLARARASWHDCRTPREDFS